MLDTKHEARKIATIRKIDTYIICFHLQSLPFSWKNEINKLYVKKGIENGTT